MFILAPSGSSTWCERALEVVRIADYVEAHTAGTGGVGVAGLLGELDAIIEDRVDKVRHGLQQVFQKLPRCPSVSLVDQLGDRELARAVDADEQVQLAPSTGSGQALWVCTSAISMWKKPIG